jgi:hypothetical protein
MTYQPNLRDSSVRINQIMNSDARCKQVYKILKIMDYNPVNSIDITAILEIQKEKYVRFYFHDYTRFITNESVCKSHWFGDRGWAYLKILKNKRIRAFINNFDPSFVYSQNQLVQLKNDLNDGVFHGQDVDIFFYVEKIQILDINQSWCFMDSTDVNSVLQKYNLTLPFI